MKVIRRSPLQDALRAHRRLDQIMAEVLRGNPYIKFSTCWAPAVDVYETADAYLVRMDLSGVRQEDISIELHSQVLVVRGVRPEDAVEGLRVVHQKEIDYGGFEWGYEFPEALDPDGIEANLKNGFLEIRIPKAPRSEPISVEVE